MKVADLRAIRIKLASPEDVLSWSKGEVKRAETINYRTQKPEKDGLFCEKIFGPSKDYECYCGKYKGIRFKEMVCDRCGVEVTKSLVRRERMGHIALASPCSHIWFLKGIPSSIGLLFDLPQQKLERVLYFVDYIVEAIDQAAKERLLKEAEEEYKKKEKEISEAKLGPKTKKTELNSLEQRYLKTRQAISDLQKFTILSEVEFHDLALKYGEVFIAGTGAETLVRLAREIDLKKESKKLKKEAEKSPFSEKRKILRRLKFFQGMESAGVKPEWFFLRVLPVLPPDLRPMIQLEGGRYASSDLNDLYRRVINRNNRLKYLIEVSAPEAIIRNEKRMLQESVDSLLDNRMRKSQVTTTSTGGRRLLKSLADVLSGKQGRFRRNLLGKRVDYSGRSVIASGPELQLNQCGIPKIMALELFRPFIIKKLLDKESAFNIRGASRLIDERLPEVFAALEEVAKDKLVLLNRAPTLHRLGIQAFEPILIEGEAIKVHPLVCSAYNADFDGDQMGVYLPLSDEAQQEARDLMFSVKNLLKPATGQPIISPTKDIVLGCYWLTREASSVLGEGKFFSSCEEAVMAYQLEKINIQAKIKVHSSYDKKQIKEKILETTCGRIIFNSALPEDFPFVNEEVDSKKLSRLIGQIIERYETFAVQRVLDKLKLLGFEYATISGINLGMNDFLVPPEKGKVIAEAEKEVNAIEIQRHKGFLSEEEKSSKVIEIWHRVKRKIEELVIEELPKDGPISLIVNSGARGSWAQPVQICGMKGLVSSPGGEIIELPVKNSFKEGFDVLEFFISTHGARKGTVDTALRTSASGYLTRRLTDVSHSVIILQEDCGDKEGRDMKREDAEEIGQDFVFKLVGRMALEDIKHGKKTIVKKDELIDWQKAAALVQSNIKRVKVRSPLTCKLARGICQKCYGWELGRNKPARLGEAVGVIASQSIGEPGTQLTMRTFHLGGVASGGDITRGLPRVQEILELRSLKGEGLISINEGEVKKVDLEKGEIIVEPLAKSGAKAMVKSKKAEEVRYSVPGKSEIFVHKGDKVAPGQVLSAGPLDLKKLLKISGMETVQRYIIKEIQRIYVGEGINIHDKHVEVITRQMFSLVRILDPGDSPWGPGEVVSRAMFEETRKKLAKEKKKKAVSENVLLGISRVALSSDSFLSAASFQETSRVLIKAAIEGQSDELRGLKENVMIGRMIPAGTGFKK